MNVYDKEDLIIKNFQQLEFRRIKLDSISIELLMMCNSIHNKRKWKNWINTSGKGELPPDFYNPKNKMMMDVMRIDDHTRVDKNGKIINLHNKRESEIIKELINKNKSIKTAIDKGNVHITPFAGTVGHEDHNYKLYIENFRRVINKHIDKIELYKTNHPGYKVIFFVFDESTPYMKLKNCPPPKKPGDIMYGNLHEWWHDELMIKELKESGIDYLIWYTPYKLFNSSRKVKYPLAVIYDVNKIKHNKTINYDINELESMEF